MSPLGGDQNRPSDAGNADSEAECSNRVRNEPPAPSDPCLAALVAAWPSLPEAVRMALTAIVSATGGTRGG